MGALSGNACSVGRNLPRRAASPRAASSTWQGTARGGGDRNGAWGSYEGEIRGRDDPIEAHHTLGACASPPFLATTMQELWQRHSAPNVEGSDALWGAELVSHEGEHLG